VPSHVFLNWNNNSPVSPDEPSSSPQLQDRIATLHSTKDDGYDDDDDYEEEEEDHDDSYRMTTA